MGRVKKPGRDNALLPAKNITAGLSVRARRKAGNARTAYQQRIDQALKGLRNLPIDPLERLDVLIPRAGLVRSSCPMWVSSPNKAQTLCQALQKDGPDARDVTPMLMDFLDHVERHLRLPVTDLQIECRTPHGPHLPCHNSLDPPPRAQCWEHIIKASSLPDDMSGVIARELMESLNAAHSRFIRKRNKTIAKKRSRIAAGCEPRVSTTLDQVVGQMMPRSPFAKKLVRVHALFQAPWTEPSPRNYIEHHGDDNGNDTSSLRDDADQAMEIDEDEEGYDLRPKEDDDNLSENGSFVVQEDWEDNEPDMNDNPLLLSGSARPIADFAQKSNTSQPFGDLAQLLASAPSAGQKIDVSRVDFQGSTLSIAFGSSAHAGRTTKQAKRA